MSEKKMIYLQPIPVRIWHWLNALGIVTLCVTGAQIRFPEYVNIFGTYKSAIELHNAAGLVVVASFALWIAYYFVFAGTLIKLYVPTMDDLQKGILRQALFYFFFYFLGRPNPHHTTPTNKFNPMQKAAYLFIMVALVPLVIVTGLILLYLGPLHTTVLMFGGMKVIVSVHFLVACCLCAFVFTHVYLATLGHTPFAHFVPMWTGWEEEEEVEEQHHGAHH